MSRWAKFWSLTRHEKVLFCEAIILLLISNFCVRVIAFRRIEKVLRTRFNDGVRSCINGEHEIKLIQRAVSRAGNVLPWKSLCLSRSIAEYIMLRRRGIPAVMLAGARFAGHSALDAHAWVDTGLGVNDNRSKNDCFTVVIRIGPAAVDR